MNKQSNENFDIGVFVVFLIFVLIGIAATSNAEIGTAVRSVLP